LPLEQWAARTSLRTTLAKSAPIIKNRRSLIDQVLALPAPTKPRIGTEGHRRLDPHPDPGAAINALARLAGRKRRRGYQDRVP
jgi:hypothetical protein